MTRLWIDQTFRYWDGMEIRSGKSEKRNGAEVMRDYPARPIEGERSFPLL